jgi:toxin-antitoxin system PIN domain toxin
LRTLFDVNVLIAFFQPDHVHHELVHQWWAVNRDHGWATCPITENGFVRILSQPKYPLPQTVSSAMKLLSIAQRDTDHEFWPDTLSILDPAVFVSEAFSSHGQITDSYLLALAVENRGRFVTLDHDIRFATVARFSDRHLVVL